MESPQRGANSFTGSSSRRCRLNPPLILHCGSTPGPGSRLSQGQDETAVASLIGPGYWMTNCTCSASRAELLRCLTPSAVSVEPAPCFSQFLNAYIHMTQLEMAIGTNSSFWLT